MVSFIGGLSSRTCVLTPTLLSPTEVSGEQQCCGEFYRWSFQQNMCAYSYPVYLGTITFGDVT